MRLLLEGVEQTITLDTEKKFFSSEGELESEMNLQRLLGPGK
jgi:hypothetical protein